MKQTLEDFINSGLDKLDRRSLEIMNRRGSSAENRLRYRGNAKSDFDGQYFKSKAEAKRYYQVSKSEEDPGLGK